MTERERWIVYPLLFLALGASLRDKFTQQVTTDRLHAGQISCEQLLVTDSEKPDRIVAKLSSNPPQSGGPADDRFGVLALYDSAGEELCGVTNNQLFVKQIICEGVAVVDPANSTRTLAGLGSVAAAPEAGGKPQRFGVLALNNEQFGTLTGNPPPALRQPTPPQDTPVAEAPPDESAG